MKIVFTFNLHISFTEDNEKKNDEEQKEIKDTTDLGK